MSVTRRIFFGAAAGWMAKGVTIILGLVLMPILFRNLSKPELGVWLLLGQSWAALGIFDLGFWPTLTRRIAFAKGKSSADPNAPLSEAAVAEIGELVATGQRIYHALSIFAFLFSITAGFFYLRHIDLQGVPITRVWIAWGVLCLCQSVNVWAMVWDCLLQGVGYIGWDAILGSCAQTLILSAQIVAVLMGGGLVTLAVIAAIGGVIQRYLWRGFALNRRPELVKMRGHWKKGLIGNMTPLALRAWVTALGQAMILYADPIMIGLLFGPAAIPAYRAAWGLVHMLTQNAVTLGLASGVFISQLWKAGEIGQVHRIVIRNVRLGLLVMLSGSAVLLVFGQSIFSLWLKVPGSFAGYRIIAAFLLAETLETQSYIISTSSRATEDEAFAASSILAGVLKLTFSYLLSLKYGLFGIAMGTTLANLCTNHWYMVYRGLRRLKFSLREYVKTILLPSLLTFPVLFGCLFGLEKLVHNASPLWRTVSAGLCAAVLFVIAAWCLVLEPGQRLRVGRKLGFVRAEA